MGRRNQPASWPFLSLSERSGSSGPRFAGTQSAVTAWSNADGAGQHGGAPQEPSYPGSARWPLYPAAARAASRVGGSELRSIRSGLMASGGRDRVRFYYSLHRSLGGMNRENSESAALALRASGRASAALPSRFPQSRWRGGRSGVAERITLRVQLGYPTPCRLAGPAGSYSPGATITLRAPSA
jgi:hypothetical protein